LPKKRLFLLMFAIFLLLFVIVGMLLGQSLTKNKTLEVQPFPQVNTSISTSESEVAESIVTSVEDKEVPRKIWYRDQVVVLTYHHVAEKSTQLYTVTTEQFAQHMSFLDENDLQPITLAEFVHFMDTGSLPTANAVLITFDDGYESYYTEAFPIMRTYNFPSVNFAIAGRVRDVAERKRENMTTPLTQQQVKEMVATGLADFGSHTYSLHAQEERNEWGEMGPVTAPVYLEDLERLEEEEEYRDRLYVDFSMSRIGVSEWLGRQVEELALPFGYTTPAVLETAKEAGFRYVFNSNPGVATRETDPFAIPRFPVGKQDVDLEQLHQIFTNAKNTFEGDQP
jgi:poly-beta-1,6-N-acetyl-D-glucosamine N-deacetylase